MFPKSLKPTLKLGIVQLRQDRVRAEGEALRIVRPVSCGLALNKLMPLRLETGCHERRLDNRPPSQAPFEQISGFGEERNESVIINLFNRARSQTDDAITPQYSSGSASTLLMPNICSAVNRGWKNCRNAGDTKAHAETISRPRVPNSLSRCGGRARLFD